MVLVVKHWVTRMPDDLQPPKSSRNGAVSGLSDSRKTLTWDIRIVQIRRWEIHERAKTRETN